MFCVVSALSIKAAGRVEPQVIRQYDLTPMLQWGWLDRLPGEDQHLPVVDNRSYRAPLLPASENLSQTTNCADAQSILDVAAKQAIERSDSRMA